MHIAVVEASIEAIKLCMRMRVYDKFVPLQLLSHVSCALHICVCVCLQSTRRYMARISHGGSIGRCRCFSFLNRIIVAVLAWLWHSCGVLRVRSCEVFFVRGSG
jgi:hypothetical protein